MAVQSCLTSVKTFSGLKVNNLHSLIDRTILTQCYLTDVIDVRTLSPIYHRVLHACSIEKGRVSLKEELNSLWLSLIFHLWPVMVLLVDKFVFRLKDIPCLDLGETYSVSLVEMTIWSCLHPKTTTSTSGPCLRVRWTTVQSTNRFSSCVDTSLVYAVWYDLCNDVLASADRDNVIKLWTPIAQQQWFIIFYGTNEIPVLLTGNLSSAIYRFSL